MGSNLGRMMPEMEIKGQRLIYKLSQNSYYGHPDKKDDTICEVLLPRITIDSIAMLVRGVRDSSYYDCNPGMMSGTFDILKIAVGTDTVVYELHNTTNEVTERSLEILNPFLPVDLRWSDGRYKMREEKMAWDELLNGDTQEVKKKKQGRRRRGTAYQWK